MAKFSLHIETDDATELAELALRLAAGVPDAPINIDAHASFVPAGVDQRAAPAAPKKGRGRPPKEAEPVAETPEGLATFIRQVTEPAEPVPEAPAPAPAPVFIDEAVTYDILKTLLTEVLKAKSAKEAQDVIRETTGGRAASLAQLTQDDYPAVAVALRKVLQ